MSLDGSSKGQKSFNLMGKAVAVAVDAGKGKGVGRANVFPKRLTKRKRR